MKKVIIASTSTVFGGTYLDYLLPTLAEHFKNLSNLVFIPFARPGGISHDEYTDKVKPVFQKLNIQSKLSIMRKLFLQVAEIRLFWLVCCINTIY